MPHVETQKKGLGRMGTESGQRDEDPAAPESAGTAGPEHDRARDLANYGAAERQTFPSERPFTPPAIDLDWSDVGAFLTACETSVPRVGYKLGANVPSDAAVPGRDFTNVDCSGFVRAAIRRSTHPAAQFPDGSVTQHDWVKAKGFATATIADGELVDDKVRIAFLEPKDVPSRIGHVVLIRSGRTAESHGGVGPDSRAFDGTGWQSKAKLYVLRS
jgi:hypothetical protein